MSIFFTALNSAPPVHDYLTDHLFEKSFTQLTAGQNLLTFGAISGLSFGRRLWLNLGLSNMRAKGLADVV